MTTENVQPVFGKRCAAKADSLKALMYRALSIRGAYDVTQLDIHARS
jgi:hypothetical protein